MRLSLALLAGALISGAAAQADIAARQNDDTTSASAAPPETTSSAGDDSGDSSTTSDSGGDVTSTTDGGDSGDTTVTRTTTVTNDDVDTVSRKTTVLTTSTTTVVITHTDFSSTTVTSRGQATATKTVYTTSTQWANQKRALDLAPRTIFLEPEAGAAVTSAPLPVSTAANIDIDDSFELVKDKRDGGLQKRATVTDVVTVTEAGDGDATTVVSTVRSVVVRTKTSDTTTTVVVTETDQADASTTVTVTSTLVETSTSVTTGITDPTGTDGSDSDSDSDNSSGGDSGGLSTGAKAGIGAGVGVAGLAIIGAIAFFCLRRRRSGPKPDPDDMYGASEVPVGGPVGGNTPPMSQHSQTAAAFLAPHRTPPKKAVSPEGYRGTAMGDGRAGYAKPEPYGAAYAQNTNRSSTLVSNNSTNPGAGAGGDNLPEHPMPAEMGDTAAARSAQLSPQAAELGPGGGGAKWHVTNAAEMDSQPATSPVSPATATTRSPPPADHVYEMPAQNYR